MNQYTVLPTNKDLLHSGGHKYIEKKMGKNGKWIYVYNKPSAGNSLRDKREANRQVTGKNMLNFLKKNSLIARSVSNAAKGPDIIKDEVEKKKNSNAALEEKEAHVKELEAQLDAANKNNGVYMYADTNVKAGGAYNLVRKTKAEIEQELITARADLDKEKTKLTAKHSYIEGNGYFIAPTGSDIVHHGRLGQQWGKRNGPPYPLNASGRLSLRKQRKAEKKAEKLAKKEADRKAALEKKQAKLDKEKARILMSGQASEAMQYKGMWTNQELRTITDRLDLELKLSQAAAKEVKTTMDKIENIANTIDRWNSVTIKGVKTYNTLASIYNASQDNKENGNYLPLVELGGGKKKDKNKDPLNTLAKAVMAEAETRFKK